MTKKELLADPQSCWNKANDDEELFILRAVDKASPIAITTWAAIAEAHGCRHGKVLGALQVADAMRLQAIKWPD